jgi:multiple sugar transport system permease protein/raffinose/stachyose/melibiose transport system permease protein
MTAARQAASPRTVRARRGLLYLAVLLVLVFFLFPFFWMISMALKPVTEIFAFPPTPLPIHATLDNFRVAINPTFLRYGLNSLIVAVVTTLVTVPVALLCAYSFTRLRFPGRAQILALIIMTQLMPLVVLVVPIYEIMGDWHLLNTYFALIVAYLTFTVPVAVWLLRGFLAGLPVELEEAARIDGCTRMGAFFRIVVPISAPGISATATYVFFLSWQEFLFALTFLSGNMQTLPVGVLGYIGEHTTDWGLLMAASSLVCVPVFVLFLFLQRQFIAGLVQGSVKG